MACSLAILALFVAGATMAAEPVAPARIYSQIPPTEPVFQSAQKTRPKPLAPDKPNGVGPARPADKDAGDLLSASDPTTEYQLLLEPPSPEALFGHLDSQNDLVQRMRQQAMQRNPPDTVKFPENPPISTATFQGRTFPAQAIFAEPHSVCYNRLYFEEKNAERYGWDLGFIQPAVSLAYFYKDVIFLAHNFMSHPFHREECSAGYCLPGDPVPYILYPPEFTVTGSIFEGAVIVGLIAAFP